MARVTVFRQRAAGLICAGDGVTVDDRECMVISTDPATGIFVVMDHDGNTVELQALAAEKPAVEPDAEPTHEAPSTLQ